MGDVGFDLKFTMLRRNSALFNLQVGCLLGLMKLQETYTEVLVNLGQPMETNLCDLTGNLRKPSIWIKPDGSGANIIGKSMDRR